MGEPLGEVEIKMPQQREGRRVRCREPWELLSRGEHKYIKGKQQGAGARSGAEWGGTLAWKAQAPGHPMLSDSRTLSLCPRNKQYKPWQLWAAQLLWALMIR